MPTAAPRKNEPNFIAPRYDEPAVVTDGQLQAVLARMQPPTGDADTNLWVHALRMWSPRAEFADDGVPSGAAMLNYYLDDRAFQQRAGVDAPPLFTPGPEGLRVRGWNEAKGAERSGAVHVDDLLATLAESGVPLDTTMILRDGQATVRDLLHGAMQRYNRQQHEYEWSAIAYARYVYPELAWRNQFGERITADDLVDELLKQPAANGICGGTHRLEALVVLNRADEEHQMLSRRTKQKLLDRLRETSALLVASQRADGYWDKTWTAGAAAASAPPGPLSDQILCTGHHLEWMALAPPEVLPPRETVIRAAQWTARTMQELDEAELRRNYGPFTHAARALSLWRGQEPWDAWVRLTAEPAPSSDAL